MRQESQKKGDILLAAVACCYLIATAAFITFKDFEVFSLSSDRTIARDFLAFYAAAERVTKGQAAAVYDSAIIVKDYQRLLGNEETLPLLGAYIHPPVTLLTMAPLALVSPQVGFLALLGVGFCILWMAVCSFLPAKRFEGICAVIACPALIPVVLQGQIAAFFLAAVFLVLAGLQQQRTGLVMTGMALAILKPTIFLLLLAIMVRGRAWPDISRVAISSFCLICLSGGILGWETWHGFLEQIVSRSQNLQAAGSSLAEMCNFRALLMWMLPHMSDFWLRLVPIVAYGMVLAVIVAPWQRRPIMTDYAISWILLAGIVFGLWVHSHDVWLGAVALVLAFRAVPRLRSLATLMLMVILVYPLFLESDAQLWSSLYLASVLVVLVLWGRCRRPITSR